MWTDVVVTYFKVPQLSGWTENSEYNINQEGDLRDKIRNQDLPDKKVVCKSLDRGNPNFFDKAVSCTVFLGFAIEREESSRKFKMILCTACTILTYNNKKQIVDHD
jgi:hypothetical protein